MDSPQPIVAAPRRWWESSKQLWNLYMTTIPPVVLLTVFSLGFVALAFLFIGSPFSSLPRNSVSSTLSKNQMKDPLLAALEKADMGNKTVIVLNINNEYTKNNSMLDLFLESLRQGEGTQRFAKHLLLATFDGASFRHCRRRGFHCYPVNTGGSNFSGEQLFMAKDYLKMTWMKNRVTAHVLRRGYNMIFTDVDIMWFRDPFLRLNWEDDVQIACDSYVGKPYDKSNAINTGFFFVRSNHKTIKLYKLLYDSRKNFSFTHEQGALGILKDRGVFDRLGLRFRFLDTAYFSGFCQKGGDLREVITMHANCCRTTKAKMVDLRAHIDAWKGFRQHDSNHSNSWPESRACKASWH